MWMLLALLFVWLVGSPFLAVVVGRGIAGVEATRLSRRPVA